MKIQRLVCDRCKYEIDNKGIIEDKIHIITFDGISREICENCFEDFREFMNNNEIDEDDDGGLI